MLTAAEIAALEHNIDHVWSLADYLNVLNSEARQRMAENPGLWCSEFTEDLSHWAEVQIFTARDLADYIDACFQREVQKSQYDYDMDDFQAGQEAGLKAGAEEERQEQAELQDTYVNIPGKSGCTLADIWPQG